MHDPLDFENRKYFDRLRRIRGLASFVLFLEKTTQILWLPFIWILVFVCLWLYSIPSMFGKAGVIAASVLFYTGLISLSLYTFKRRPASSEEDIDRQIERASRLKHRPLKALKDTLANPEKKQTRDVWHARDGKLIHALKNLRAPSPRPVLPYIDPYALRTAFGLLLIGGIIIAGVTWPDKIRQGLLPYEAVIPGFDSIDTASLTIIPPDYTGFKTLELKGRAGPEKALDIPEGSTVKARVTGGLGHPRLVMGEQKIDLEHHGGPSYSLETEILPANKLVLQQLFLNRVEWPYSLITDEPPAIEIQSGPDVLSQGELRFPLMLYDDYGVRDMHISMTLKPDITDKPLGEPFEETRAVMTPGDQNTELKPVYDLTSHTWSGLPVIFEFYVTDDSGNVSQKQSVDGVLPERQFTHPVSKKLIEYRQQLAWTPNAPADNIQEGLIGILNDPETYQGDIIVFLSLRSALSRLEYSPGTETAKALIDLFWNIAVHLEDGDISMAMKRLRDAQRELEQALNDPNVTDEELAELTMALKEAMAEYFRELGKELQKRMAEGNNMPLLAPETMAEMINPEDFMRFFDQLQAEALSGNKDAARELLSQLSKMMDMMDPALSAQMPQDIQMMAEGVNELQELIRRQEELLDQTRHQAERLKVRQDFGRILDNPDLFEEYGELPPFPEAPPPENQTRQVNTKKNKEEQEALRYILGQLMREAGEALGEIPEGMGLAEQEMRGSSAALGNNDPQASIPHQEQAIEYLKQAMQSLSEQMMARMQQMTGLSFGRQKRDPLGRRYGDQEGPDWFSGSEVKIPDEAQRKRVEEILKILRERSGEFNRPEAELEYYRRLLKQF